MCFRTYSSLRQSIGRDVFAASTLDALFEIVALCAVAAMFPWYELMLCSDKQERDCCLRSYDCNGSKAARCRRHMLNPIALISAIAPFVSQIERYLVSSVPKRVATRVTICLQGLLRIVSSQCV